MSIDYSFYKDAFGDEDLEIFMKALTIAAQNDFEIFFMDYVFHFVLFEQMHIIDAAYKTLKILDLIEIEWSDKNGKVKGNW